MFKKNELFLCAFLIYFPSISVSSERKTQKHFSAGAEEATRGTTTTISCPFHSIHTELLFNTFLRRIFTVFLTFLISARNKASSSSRNWKLTRHCNLINLMIKLNRKMIHRFWLNAFKRSHQLHAGKMLLLVAPFVHRLQHSRIHYELFLFFSFESCWTMKCHRAGKNWRNQEFSALFVVSF